MPDFRVRATYDLGNIKQFDAAVRNSAIANARAVEASSNAVASQVGKITKSFNQGIPVGTGPGLFAANTKTILDTYNRSFRQTGDIIRRSITDFKAELDEFGRAKVTPQYEDVFKGQFDRIIGDLDRYEKAIKRTARTEKQIVEGRRQLATHQAGIKENIFGAQLFQGQAQQELSDLLNKSALGQQAAILRTQVSNAATPKIAAKWAKQLQGVEQQLNTAAIPIRARIQDLQNFISDLEQESTRAGVATARRERRLISQNPAYAEARLAAQAVPPIQKDLSNVLRDSKELRKNLISAGLGLGQAYGTPEFKKALASQEAIVSRYTNNVRTGVRTVQGSFHDASGMLHEFTVDLDRNGKVVGRWGGQLSGANQFLNQSVRNLQKVVQWTIATSVVFGTLATVVTQLRDINQLNTSLARLSITAQTSGEDTRSLFRSIAQVAYDTATPLNQLVQVSDDIALATRVAGQSTDEWKNKIISLTTAVGIFTNLTGVDTVQAADQLSAAFKQLGIAPEQLLTVLNKVTAVAGGQATSIAEITKALGSVASAASAAQLTMDEQIASVQVLSQVTNKSADEIATSFKNLFGSISSPGSVKVLKQFGIAVRDATTNDLRPFLDIYRDIADAISRGIIPEGKIQDVLRGISGGPRRAPDAAALLQALPLIEQSIEKSVGATNEALIANQKILDTNAAKIQQFQNAVDVVLFEKFGQAVADATANLTSFGTTALNAFGAINTDLIATALQFVAIGVALRSLVGLAKLLGPALGFESIINGLRAMRSETALLNLQYGVSKKGNPLYRSPSGAFISAGQAQALANERPFIGTRGKLAIGAALIGGGILGTATGAGGSQDIAFALQGIGGLISFIPGLQAVGLATLGVGTALQFLTKSSDTAKQSQAELSAEVYQTIQNLKEVQTTADGYRKSQEEASTILDRLHKKAVLTTDDQKQLASATEQYVTATLGLVNANTTVSKTFDDLLSKLPNLASEYKHFVGILASAGPASAEVETLRQRVQRDILVGLNQGIYAGQVVKPENFFRPSAAEAFTTATGAQGQKFNLADLLNNPELLRNLLPSAQPLGNWLTNPAMLVPGAAALPQQPQIPLNPTAISFLQQALDAEIKLGDASHFSASEIEKLTEIILNLAVETSTVAKEAAIVAQSQADTLYRQSIGTLFGKNLENTTLADKLLEMIQTTQARAETRAPSTIVSPVGFNVPFESTEAGRQYQAAQERLTKDFDTIYQLRARGQAPSNNFIIQAATDTFKLEQSTLGLANAYEDLKAQGDDALNRGIIEWAKSAGLGMDQLNSLAQQLNVSMGQLASTAAEVQERFEAAISEAGKNFAQRSLQLQIAASSGDFDKTPARLAALTAQNQAAYDSEIKLTNSIKDLNETAYAGLVDALDGVIGLQYLANLSSDDLTEAQQSLGVQLIENAVAAGVNEAGIKKITEALDVYIATLNSIPPYKYTLVDVETRIRKAVDTGDTRGESIAEHQLDEILRQETAADKAGQALADTINEIMKKYGVLNRKPSGAGAAPPKPGLLDIPKEFIDQSSLESIRKALLTPETISALGFTDIKQLLAAAVARARALQHLVPGEDKANKKTIVELLSGTQRILETRGVGEEYLRKALEELTTQVKKQNDLLDKANAIRRIRVGAGDFSALANVPLNTKTGISVGSPEGPITINLNINGQLLTPAQFSQIADQLASALKKQLASSGG